MAIPEEKFLKIEFYDVLTQLKILMNTHLMIIKLS